MSAPSGGARVVPVTPGSAAVMLTEYAGGADNPLQLINASVTAGRVYIGADSSVSTSNGVPLDPGTSMQWSFPGQVWAVADPAAVGAIAITLTTAVSDWQASPAAIAAYAAVQTAQQLLAGGVPNVLVEKIVANFQVIPPLGQATFDISGYASLIVSASRHAGASGDPVSVYLQQSALGVAIPDQEKLFGFGPTPTRIAVVGTSLTVQNLDNVFSLDLNIVGSNRPAQARLDGRRITSHGDRWSIANTTMALNTVYPLTQDDNLVSLQGLAFAAFTASGSGGTSGRFEVLTGAGVPMILADTGEMVVSANATRYVGKLIALPAPPWSIQFRCLGTAGVSAPVCTFIPAEI